MKPSRKSAPPSAIGRSSPLFANAGVGLERAFLDQEWNTTRKVVDLNIMGTIELVQEVARGMARARAGRIVLTGLMAGFMPGAFQWSITARYERGKQWQKLANRSEESR
jgi:NADP-dependent 3-hydroxy acid dehydrogenase YdfG